MSINFHSASLEIRNRVAEQLQQVAAIVGNDDLGGPDVDRMLRPMAGDRKAGTIAYDDTTPPDSGILLVRVPPDQRTGPDGFRLPCTFIISRKLATEIAVECNTRLIERKAGQLVSAWHVVVREINGFRVVKVTCRGFKPHSPTDIPPDTTPTTGCRSSVHRTVAIVNGQVGANWLALHVKPLATAAAE